MNIKDKIKSKLAEMQTLAVQINLHTGQIINQEQKQEVQNWQDKMEFRLNSLVDESKLKEAEIKIEIYQSVLKYLNKK